MKALARMIAIVLGLSLWSAGGILWAATQAPSPVPPSPQQAPGHGDQPQYGSFGQQAASIQALTSVGSDLLYAGSFGLGLFRSEDRGVNWAKSGQGVTDPFILTHHGERRRDLCRNFPWRGFSFPRSREELAGDQ